jgi:Ca2+-binding RTX toxin-like protein
MSNRAKVAAAQIQGTVENEKIENTAAIEVIDGGEGIDTLTFAEGKQGVRVNLAKGEVRDPFNNAEKVANIEIVIGTSFDDRMTGSANGDIFVGADGNDRLNGNAGQDELYGGNGNDTINGGDDSDYIVGGRGNDQISGGRGFDTVDYSDEGGDRGIVINLGRSTGTDTYGDTDRLSNVESIRGTDLSDSIIGSSGNNWLRGGAGDDTIDGGNGSDVIWGSFGNDNLVGGRGDDAIAGGRGDDTMDGGNGIDTLDYANDEGWRGVSVNMSTGTAEDTWGSIDVYKGFENVTGSQFDDWIMGDAKANVIEGGAGNDVLAGGGGNDTFVFAAGHGQDVINDFGAGDRLDLRGLGWTSLDDVLANAEGHELGVVINTGEDTSIVLVDVNVNALADLGYLFV